MKFFKKVKEIRSRDGALHFTRFAIFECSFFAIYIHKIYNADKDPFTHSHPWNFAGIVLKGSYVEKFLDNSVNMLWHYDTFIEKIKRVGSLGFGNRGYFHKIQSVISPVTTLFFTFGRKKPWYFLTNQGKVESSEYIKNKSKYELPRSL